MAQGFGESLSRERSPCFEATLASIFKCHCPVLVLAVLMLPNADYWSCAQAEELWGLTSGNELINFASTDPSICGRRSITGLEPGDEIVGIDFRPTAPFMHLYALANTGRLYLIADPASGVASLIGNGPPVTLTGSAFGLDFDTAEDYLRVVSDVEENFRIDADLGAVLPDSKLFYAAGDPNAGTNPTVTAVAYTAAPSTTLYAIDSSLRVLTMLGNPSGGAITTIGSLGVNPLSVNGFDVSAATGVAFAALVAVPIPEPSLFVIDLTTGGASFVAAIACEGASLRGLSVANATSSINPSTWGQIKAIRHE